MAARPGKTWSIVASVLVIFLLCLKVRPRRPDPRQGVEHFLWWWFSSPTPATVTSREISYLVALRPLIAPPAVQGGGIIFLKGQNQPRPPHYLARVCDYTYLFFSFFCSKRYCHAVGKAFTRQTRAIFAEDLYEDLELWYPGRPEA